MTMTMEAPAPSVTNAPEEPCVFCDIIMGKAPAVIWRQWEPSGESTGVWAIVPLKPVVPGHTLIIPTRHVRDALENPKVTAEVMRCAAEWARGPANIITSIGSEATQTVFHLHIHVVPRRYGDRLRLPWT